MHDYVYRHLGAKNKHEVKILKAKERVHMARPIKWRKIDHYPTVERFVPAKPGQMNFEENVLKLEELEAIRLKDLLGLEQEECASKMQVSRPTFHRILMLARSKIADSLVAGKAIRIAGGNFTRNICQVVCLDCGYQWTESYENMMRVNDDEYLCPECKSGNISCSEGRGKFCRGNCRRHGRKRY